MTQGELNQKCDAFFAKYDGKTKGYPTDAQYSGECLSIAKLYIKEVFGFSPPPSGVNSAYGYWTNFPAPLGDYFDKIPCSAGMVPQKGDIPIWSANLAGSGGYGHIDIATGNGDTSHFEGFDQNWGGRQAHRVSHNYNDLYGWLRPKLTRENDMIPHTSIEGRVYNADGKLLYWIDTPATIDKYFEGGTGPVKPIDELIPPKIQVVEKIVDNPDGAKQIDDLVRRLGECQTQLTEARELIEKQPSDGILLKIAELSAANGILTKQNAEKTIKIDYITKQIEDDARATRVGKALLNLLAKIGIK